MSYRFAMWVNIAGSVTNTAMLIALILKEQWVMVAIMACCAAANISCLVWIISRWPKKESL